MKRNHNYGIEKFFVLNSLNKKLRSGNIQKHASFNQFPNVYNSSDIVNESKMISEMIALPKYDQIKNSLKNYNGIVNFVTRNEYAPLVELLLKSAIPPSQNDVYHMGVGDMAPGDYAVNAKSLFGTGVRTTASPESLSDAHRVFSNILLGSRKKATPQWMVDNNIGEEQLQAYFMNKSATPEEKQLLQTFTEEMQSQNIPPEQRRIKWANYRAKNFMKLAQEYFLMIEQVRSVDNDSDISILKKEVNQLSRKLRADMALKLQSNNNDDVQDNLMDAETREQIVNELRVKRNLLFASLQNILNDPRYSLLETVVDAFSGAKDREKDGFISWSPAQDIINAYNIVKNPKLRTLTDRETKFALQKLGNRQSELTEEQKSEIIEEKTQKAIGALMKVIDDYDTNDIALLKKKDEIKEIVGHKKKDFYRRFFQNIGTVSKKINAFLDRALQHGRVMILTDIEDSILCVNRTGKKNELADAGILKRFVSVGDANSERDNLLTMQYIDKQDRYTKYNETKGQRKLIIVSKEPLGELPNAVVVDVGTSPVDEDEARIIVKYKLMPYQKDMEEMAQLEEMSRIERENGDKSYDELKNIRNKAMWEFNQNRKNSFYEIPTKIETTLVQAINGIGQKQAFFLLDDAVKKTIKQNTGEDGEVNEISLNYAELSQTLIDEFNKKKLQDVRGILPRKSKVKYNQYITKAESTWAYRVRSLWATVRDLQNIEKEINAKQIILGKINAKLNLKISEESRKILTQERDYCLRLIQELEQNYNNLTMPIPHVYMLYGGPGVGKSVFGDALADAFGYMVKDVDINAAKSKWVGETGEFTTYLINSVFSCTRTVFIIDELDRMLQMSHGSQGVDSSDSAHETTKDQVAKLLSAFGDRMPELMKKQVFVVATTNHIKQIDTALLDRFLEGKFEVEASNDPKDFLQFLQNYVDQAEHESPDLCSWVNWGVTSGKEGWAKAKQMIHELDLPRIAKVFAKKQIGLRQFGELIKRCFEEHGRYIRQVEVFKRGDFDEIMGMPLTTENVIRSANRAKSAKHANEEQVGGVIEAGKETYSKLNAWLAENLNTIPKDEEIQDIYSEEIGGSKIMGRRILPEMDNILSGRFEVSTTDDTQENNEDDYEKYIPVIDQHGEESGLQKMDDFMNLPPSFIPIKDRSNKTVAYYDKPNDPNIPFPNNFVPIKDRNGKVIALREYEIQNSNINNLVGFEEEVDDVGVDNVEDDETVLSSTDYFYNFLKKRGIINKGGKINNDIKKDAQSSMQNNVASPNRTRTDANMEMAKNGIYLFSPHGKPELGGQIVVAPAFDKVSNKSLPGY